MAKRSSASSRLNRFFVPARASTLTWMALTFLFFVGMAVVAVSLYITFVLQREVQVALEQTMRQNLTSVARAIDSEPTRIEQLQVARQIAQLSDYRITIAADGEVLLDVRGVTAQVDTLLLQRPEMQLAPEMPTQIAEREVNGQQMIFAALLGRDKIIRIGQTPPPLLILIRRMQITLIIATVIALVLAVIGSWISAQQVTRPLLAIRNSARSISDGNLDKEIIVDSRMAEMQDVAASLNHMSDAFKEKIDELERLARLQNEFIGNVSHEVRNPIFSVGGYLEALTSSKLSAAQRRLYAEKGLSNLERLNNLFSDLIEIARLEYREDLIKTSVFNLKTLADDVYEFLGAKAEKKGLELVVENPTVFVIADRNRIRQVLINLIENAVIYSDTGTVRCRFRRRLDKVRIEVVDTGRGIPEEHREKIFERFHRVDPDRSRKSGGTGLGLSIVKQILHAHGEAVHVESTLGRGTRFWFELPFAEMPADADER